MTFSELLLDPGSQELLESFQYLLYPEKYKRKNIQHEAFSCVAVRLQTSDVLNLTYMTSVPMLKTVAMLSWESYLTCTGKLLIQDINITDIPSDQMEKLTSIVKHQFKIDKMTHTNQLGNILASVKCERLVLKYMELSERESRALVKAMRDRVKAVMLESVTLDVEELRKYDGQGSCKKLQLYGDMMYRYGERIRSWVQDMGWTLDVSSFDGHWMIESRLP